ncbi:hypothetical protein RCC89_02490 [Cytophagaceae bacterium ABcell3]|nr:hypothetical protein RCC89_02490 [Cytophagaceae bacterium ABcell3]
MANKIPNSHGLGVGVFNDFNYRQNGNSILGGITLDYSNYGKTTQEKLPFNNYYHGTADINNTHNLFNIGLTFRYQFNRVSRYFSPFFEVGPTITQTGKLETLIEVDMLMKLKQWHFQGEQLAVPLFIQWEVWGLLLKFPQHFGYH